ncbi:MAG: efflux RND transporter periplasmic adaptor subunit [Holosporaceae bacterium]|jgi:membrane fusion protein (multidrug efflux system)|nr:efflux RND transporter periplasmic adaptor subunit [Holosporaceae bacterium]
MFIGSVISFLRKEKCKILAVIALIAVIVYFKFLRVEKSAYSEHTKIVETEIVARSSIKHEIKLIGIVRPKHYCVLTAKAGGTIDTLVLTGSSLKKGDLIAKIENPDIEKTHRLSISAREIAQRQYDRMFSLVQKKVRSKKEADEAHQHLIEADKNLARASIEHENTLLKAPFDGILGVYKIKDGEQVVEGNQVATFYNYEQLLVEFDIPSQYIHMVNPGQEMTVNGQTLVLKHVQKAIDEESHMCPASVEVKSANDNLLLIGGSVDVTLTIEKKPNAIVISGSAVFIHNGKDVVYVVKDGKTDLREVEVGIKSKEKIEITKGLAEKEEVVVIAQDRLYPGMPVKIAGRDDQPKTSEKNDFPKAPPRDTAKTESN